MSFQRMVPGTAGVLKEYMQKMHENRNHVNGVKMNPASNHLEIDLDRMANFAGYPDIYMPIKRSKANDAKLLAEKLVSQSKQGFPPSDGDVQALFDMIDHEAR